MSKIAFATLLLAVSLQAQTVPDPQGARGTSVAVVAQTPSQPSTPGTPQRERLIDMQFFSKLPAQSSHCVVPLRRFPVDNARYAMKTSPANPAIDPRIVKAPPLAVCAESLVPQKIVPVQPSTGTK